MTYSDPSIDVSEGLEAGLDRYFIDTSARRYPYEFLNALRGQCPVAHSKAGPWLVTEYNAVKAMLRDDRFSRQAASEQTLQNIFEPGRGLDLFRSGITTLDGQAHLRLRNLLNKRFAPSVIAKWRPTVEAVAAELVSNVRDAGSAEFVSSIAYPLPEWVICELLGVPHEDHELFKAWSATVTNRRPSLQMTDADRREATLALEHFFDYLYDLVEKRRRDQRDDLVSELIAIEEDGDKLSRDELVSILRELITGGHETTASVATNGTAALLTHRDQWERLVADPSLIPSAVEEILRYFSSAQMSLVRVTTEDVELAGERIPAGSVVYANLAAAGRDPSMFEDPDTFDIGRQPNRHLGFGFGGHFCIGAGLARLELAVLLETLVRELPTLRLADRPLEWRDHGLVNSLAELHVEW